MLSHVAVRILRLAELRCQPYVLCSASRTCVLILLISAAYCAELKVLNSDSEFLSTGVQQRNTTSSESDKTPFPKGVTDEILDAPSSVNRYQSSGNSTMEIMSLQFSDDYDGDYADNDDFNLSHVAPEVLVDLGPEEMVLSMKDGAPPQGRRKPVKDGFVRDQEVELLRLHNHYRGNVTPPAADMSFMEWNDELAKIAQVWANGCLFKHGFPPNSSVVMGQNLYMGFDPTGVRAMLLWFAEYDFYNFATRECTSDKQCGHYTQLVWGGSSLVGCGMKRCGYKRFFVVCHYSPPGNIATNSPYVVGKPCSLCPSDQGGLCINKLCVTEDQCSRNEEKCVDAECPLECHNCGTLNSTLCKCSCADGWDALDCSRRCRNDHEGCGKKNGFPTPTYCSLYQHDIANIYCREMCGRCRHIEDLSATSTCCNGVLCDDGYVLDQKKNLCKCKLLCPGPRCYDDGRILNRNISEQDTGPIQKNTSSEDRGLLYKNISHQDNSTIHKNVSDESTGLRHESNGSVYQSIPDVENETIYAVISDEDSGSQYPSMNTLMILLPLIIKILFLS